MSSFFIVALIEKFILKRSPNSSQIVIHVIMLRFSRPMLLLLDVFFVESIT